MPVVTGNGLQLLRHAIQWLANLRRARESRKRESIQALRRVVTAARETTVYLRQLNNEQRRDHAVERHLTVLWTELGFALQDLGLHKLAKRCQITGKHWASPEHFREDYLQQADVGLERMEQLARQLLAEVETRRRG